MDASVLESTFRRSTLKWARIDGLTAENAGISGEVLNPSTSFFASIGGSLFGRWRRNNAPEVPPAEEQVVPYSPQRGTFAYESLQRKFKELDKDNHGYITENQLKITLKNLSLPASEEDVQTFLRELTRTTVPFDRFAEYAVDRENMLYDTFKELDKTNTGYLTTDELKDALQRYHFRFNDGDLASTLNKYDRIALGPYNQTRLFDFADFRDFLMVYSKRDLRDENEVWGRAVIDSGDIETSFPLCLSGTEARDSKFVARHLTMGAVASAVSRTVTAPLERIKTLSMTGTEKPANLWAQIWSDEKLKGIFRGNLLNIARIIPAKVAEFFVYDKLKEVARRKKQEELTNQDRLLLGTIASLAGAVAAYPLDTLRVMVTSQLPNRYVDDLLVKSVIENGGLPSLYKGIVPNLIRVIPYGLVTFTIFEQFEKQYREKNGPGGEIGASTVALYGIAALLAAQTVVHPFEVVQRRLQVEAAKQGPLVYKNMVTAFSTIVEKEGFQGLYSGLPVSCAKIVPATAASLFVYNLLKEKMNTGSVL